MSTRASRFGALVLGAFLASLAAFTGCRQVLSIEERELEENPLTCEAYCEQIQSLCTGNNLQFSTVDACIGLCSTYPLGTIDDQSGHTLGCRIHVLETSKAMIESSDCAAAGPGGNGVCGTNCESFCTSMKTVCPQGFESDGDCDAVCAPLIECGSYYVDSQVTPDDPSINCRLYHLSAAAINILSSDGMTLTTSQTKHCPHALGETECIFVDPPETSQCP
jgi:hypothetical protein